MGTDSVSLVELTLALEEEFDIEITDEDAQRMRTVQDAIRFIETAVERETTNRFPSSRS